MEYVLPDVNLNDLMEWLGHFDLILRLKDIRNEKVCFSAAAACLEGKSLELNDIFGRVKEEKCEKPYSRLRELLVEHLTRNKQERVRFGLELQSFGTLGLTPSSWLAKLSSLWRDVTGCDILRETFMKNLPPELALTSRKLNLPLVSLAWQADTYLMPPGPSLNMC